MILFNPYGKSKKGSPFFARAGPRKSGVRALQNKKSYGITWENTSQKKGAMDLQAREKIEYALEQIRKGQDEGVETLYVLMGRTMLFVANGVVRDRHAAEDVCRALSACGTRATYTAESLSQFSLLCRLAAESGSRLPVLLRLSCGNQFGMDERTLCSLLERKDLPVEIEGVQYYSGTQKRIEAVRREVQMLQELCRKFPCIRRVEYGPGLRVAYFAGDAPEDDLQEFSALLSSFPPECEIVIELGRSVAADCGEYHTRIVDLKETDGTKYCIVDGGIHHLKYYGQTMAMKLPPVAQYPARAGGAEEWTVCGSLCTTADVLVKNLPLTGAKEGDVLVFSKAGAYSVTEGISLFLSRPLPRVYQREGETLTLLRDFIKTSQINQKE